MHTEYESLPESESGARKKHSVFFAADVLDLAGLLDVAGVRDEPDVAGVHDAATLGEATARD